jgi:hypothetical protein
MRSNKKWRIYIFSLDLSNFRKDHINNGNIAIKSPRGDIVNVLSERYTGEREKRKTVKSRSNVFSEISLAIR